MLVGSQLEFLDLSLNNFGSSIPPELGKLKNLRSLNLSGNYLVSNIPNELKNLENLQDLQVSGNRLNVLHTSKPITITFPGKFFQEFAQCNNLTLLNLAFNGFTGTVPPEFGELANLQELILSGNSLIREIPDSLLKCKNLSKLDISINRLNGTLPRELCKAPKIHQNSLRGEIPSEIGNCAKLLELQLGNNYLTGIIPPEMVNFSHNSLTGQVPVFAPFQKSPNSSFYGNKGLCEELLGISCGNSLDSEQTYHHRVSYKIVLAVIGSGLAVFVSVSIINLKQAIDFNSVVKVTLKESNKLHSGTFSSTYKEVMSSGLILSVKRLNSIDRTIIHHQNKIMRELERPSKLCHEHLIRPVGFVIYEESAITTPFLGISKGCVLLQNGLATESSRCKRGVAFYSQQLISPYAYTMEVTAPGNVYSYGVVLLEILTTRSPVDESFGEGIDLVKWVHTNIGFKVNTVSFAWRKQMLAVLKVALLCTDTTPAKRPKMKKVVELLQEVN
ncbi:hypothetical protein MKW92_037454 [Papaver armeniacum]|nr:hypothetical protein MKW92_037454 [Papaver armeniacum]